jgi:hypothetical protein
MNTELCLDEKLAIMFGLSKVDSIHSKCSDTYAWFTPPFSTKPHLVYRGEDDIYENDYNTWNPSQNLDLIMMVVEKFANPREFYLEALSCKDTHWHTQDEFALLLSEYLVEKFWRKEGED